MLQEEFKFRLKYQSLDIDIDIDWCQQENFYNFRLLSAELLSCWAHLEAQGSVGNGTKSKMSCFTTQIVILFETIWFCSGVAPLVWMLGGGGRRLQQCYASLGSAGPQAAASSWGTQGLGPQQHSRQQQGHNSTTARRPQHHNSTTGAQLYPAPRRPAPGGCYQADSCGRQETGDKSVVVLWQRRLWLAA